MHRICTMSAGTPVQNSHTAQLPENFLYKQSIGSMLDGWIQSTENRLSQWFWQGINSLPKDYFAKDITNIDYQDKLFWEGIFNDKIEYLKEQFGTEWLAKSSIQLDHINDQEAANLNKLKEQTAAGFLQGDLSLEAHLIQLQGIVGKNTLSPQCYESGLEDLKQSLSQSYVPVIEKTLRFFREELKQQPEFLAECFQEDVFDLFKQNQPLSGSDLQQILDYYRPLMKHKHYIKQQNWLKACYDVQSLLPPPPLSKPTYQQPPEKTPATKKSESKYWYSIGNMSKFLWEHAGKLVTLGLATQVAAVQAGGNYNMPQFTCVEDTKGIDVVECTESFIINLVGFFEQINSNDTLYPKHIFPITSVIKDVMKSSSYPDISKYHNCKLKNIIEMVPLSVKNLIWSGNNCSIKNSYFNEYLYAANYGAFDSYRRSVFTWKAENDVIQDNWRIIPKKNGYFHIYNIYQKEYLYAANYGAFDDYRRRVFTWKAGNDVTLGNWQIIPKKNGYFHIYNICQKEYLYAADYGAFDSYRRGVFTWKDGDDPKGNNRFLWDINCVNALLL